MKKNYLKTKPLLIGILISIGLNVCDETKTIANPITSIKVSPELAIKNTENKNLVRETKQNNTANYKNNSVKSSSQQLVGGWTVTTVDDSGKKIQDTIFYEPDGTYYHILTINDLDWYIYNRGSWQVSDGILYENTESGENLKGSIKFISNNEFTYQSENGTTKWQRINSKPNLSAEQLLGTWSIVVQDRISGSLINDFYQRAILKLIELNPDGTFRYKSTDARFSALSIKVSRSAGTWEYVNAGYADGILLLKNSQGQLVSIGSVNWTSNGNFLHLHRSQYDPSKNQYTPGRIEEFNRTDLKID